MQNTGTQPPNVFHSREVREDPGPPRLFAPSNSTTYAVMLGSGKPEPTPHRYGPGGAVIAQGMPYIIDAGEGIWRAIAKAATAHDGKLTDALAPSKLTRLFITHLHSDHTIGLASLLLLPWIHGRKAPMEIYGPVGTRRLVELILEAYRADTEERVYGPEQKDDTGWRATVHEIVEPGLVYRDNRVRVEAFHHTHGGFKQNFGYRFLTGERSIVWPGDGVDSPSYREAIRDADILFSDVASSNEQPGIAAWRGYDTDVPAEDIWHMKSRQLGRMAEEAGVKTVVLHHEQNYSEPYDPEALVKEVKQHYRGVVISARDGDVY